MTTSSTITNSPTPMLVSSVPIKQMIIPIIGSRAPMNLKEKEEHTRFSRVVSGVTWGLEAQGTLGLCEPWVHEPV